jgi:hypothetical protein
MESSNFVLFEDPVTNQMMLKEHYNLIYGPALRELFDNDTDIKVDLFFVENPLTQGEWRLTDEDSRLDIYDLSVEMELIHNHSEICAGETDDAKYKRNEKEKNKIKLHQNPVKSVITRISTTERIERLGKVEQRLKEDISNKERKRLKREMRGIIRYLEHSV